MLLLVLLVVVVSNLSRHGARRACTTVDEVLWASAIHRFGILSIDIWLHRKIDSSSSLFKT